MYSITTIYKSVMYIVYNTVQYLGGRGGERTGRGDTVDTWEKAVIVRRG